MGTDVYSESGIIATTDDVIGLLRKKDLKKVIIITGAIEDKIVLPLKFIITNKGLVFKIKYTGHKKNDW